MWRVAGGVVFRDVEDGAPALGLITSDWKLKLPCKMIRIIKLFKQCCLFLLVIFAIAQSELKGNEVLKAAEEAYLEAKEEKGDALKQLLENAGESTGEEWKKIDEMWKELVDLEAKVEADITSGGGSAFTSDYLGFLADAHKEREKFYRRILGRLKTLGSPSQIDLNE